MVFCEGPLNFNSFSTCFVDFVSSVFSIRFSQICDAIWGSILHYQSAKTVRAIALKKAPPTSKRVAIDVSRGSQRGRLACALLNQETTVRAQKVVRIGFHRFFETRSNMLFELVSIANVRSIQFSTLCKGSMSKAHYSWSDTPLAKAWRTVKTNLITNRLNKLLG